jgi:serine protease Do
MTSLPRICFALFVSLTSLRAGTPLTPQRPAQTPARRPLSARQVAQKVLPSVVYIEMASSGGSPGCYGSGFFVSRTEILTNKHVVTCSGAGRGTVKLVGGKRVYPTTTILAWPDLDLALVEAEGLSASPLQLETGRALGVGDDIFVAGNPAGLEGTFTRGIVSGVRSREGLLQIDAPISRGSSGGPVVDVYGRVVGITISSISEGQNLNFAIPAASLVTPLERMRRMMTRRKSIRAADRSTADRAGPPASQPAPASPARRTWESNPDWAGFFSPVVADAAIKDELKALLASGLSVNAKDRHGRAALHLAATLGQAEPARFLLSRRADSNAKDARGRTPLMLAVGPGDLTPLVGDYAPLGDIWIGPLCVDGNASAEASGAAAGWARWYALLERRRPLVKILLDAGANPDATDDERRTAFDHAAAGGATGFERLLGQPARDDDPRVCGLTVARPPTLGGLFLGMTREDISARLRGLTLPPPDSCGLAYVAVPASRLITPSQEFEGISLLRLAFVDGRLAYLHVAYEPGGHAKGFEEYLSTLSATLGLQGRWRRAFTGGSGFDNAHSVACDGFTAVAGRLKVPYVELHDTEALRTLVRRWEELPERPRKRQVIKP